MKEINIEKVIPLLELNTLNNIVLLKHVFQLQNNAKYISCNDFICIQFSPNNMQHDRKLYSDYKTINILSSDNVDYVQKYIELLPKGKHILKTNGFLNNRNEFTLLRSFQSLTINKSISKTIQNEIYYESVENINKYETLFGLIDYKVKDIEELINTCSAFILSIKVADKPVASCIIYQVYKNIWEIGALSTLVEFRRKHLAEELVIYATNLIISRQQTPRYHVNTENTASLNLAIKCGYSSFINFNHYSYEKES